MYSPDAISVTAPAISKPFWYLLRKFRFFSHPTAQAPRASEIARPNEKPSSSTAPKRGDSNPAAAPSKITSAGVQTGQTATEKTIPSANAPHTVVGGVTRIAKSDGI